MDRRVCALTLLARLTRRAHPRGTDRLLRALHDPDRRPWSVRATVTLPNGVRLALDTASFIEWRLFFYGAWEPEGARLLRRSVRPGCVAVDVGANIGAHALAMAHGAPHVTVLACEPNPRVFRRLAENIALNPRASVHALPLALSDAPGTAMLFVPPETRCNQGTASLQRNALYLSDAEAVEVQVDALDNVVERLGLSDIDVIKIDVEGREAAVLRGARRTLARDHPRLLFEFQREYWMLNGSSLATVLDELRALGYHRFFRVTRGGPAPLPDGEPEFMNVYAV